MESFTISTMATIGINRHSFLPGSDIRNIVFAYSTFAATKSWFTAAIWLFFFRDTVTDSQIGTLFSLGVIVLVVLEVPSGILADLIGHRKVLIIAGGLSSIGYSTIGFNTGYYSLLAGLVLAFAGTALYSGALDAFAYESLKEAHKETLYEKFAGAQIRLGLIVKASSAFIGALLFFWQRNVPNLALASAHLINMICLILFTHEPQKELPQPSQTETLGTSATSWIKTFIATMKNPLWRPIIILAVATHALATTLGWGPFELSLAETSGFNSKNLYLFLVPSIFIEAYLVGLFGKVSTRIQPIQGLYITAVVAACTYLAFSVGNIAIFMAGFLIVSVSHHCLQLFMLSYIQKRLNPAVRASALSTISLLRWVIIAVMAYISGIAADNNWILQLSTFVGAAIIGTIALQTIVTRLIK